MIFARLLESSHYTHFCYQILKQDISMRLKRLQDPIELPKTKLKRSRSF